MRKLAIQLLSGIATMGMAWSIPTSGQTVDLELNEAGTLVNAGSMAPGLIEGMGDKPAGVMGEIFGEISKRLSLKPQLDVYDFPALIPVLQSDRADMIGPNLSITQARAQVFYFAPAILIQPETIAVRPGTKITSWEQAKNDDMTLASIAGFFQIGLWESMGIKVHAFDNVAGCMLDVAKNAADGCDVGAFDLAYFQLKNPSSEVADLQITSVSGPNITTDMNSFGISKDRPLLALAVTQAIRDMWRDGTMEAIWKKGVGEERFTHFINAPEGQAVYTPGPWEANVVAPAADDIATPATLEPGTLVVGVIEGPMLTLSGDELSGPEATILTSAAEKLKLKIKAVPVKDPVAALNDGNVDIVAGTLAQEHGLSKQLWYSLPVGFNPDYIYVAPDEGGNYPKYTKWEDVTATGAKIAIVSGDRRITEIGEENVQQFPDAAAALRSVADGRSGAFVGSSIEFAKATAGNPDLVQTSFSWVRNANLKVHGEAYAWGVRWGNAELSDALDGAITAAWQGGEITRAYLRHSAAPTSPC